jgi:hypothetical protein
MTDKRLMQSYIFEATPEEDARLTHKNGRTVLTWRQGSVAKAIVFQRGTSVRIEIISPL